MEFKKCVRCGCFFASSNNVCCNCESKDNFDIAKLNNFIEENDEFSSIEELSNLSGININNLNRYISNNKIRNYDTIESEVADVFIVLCTICNKLDIDLFSSLKDKEKENIERKWKK